MRIYFFNEKIVVWYERPPVGAAPCFATKQVGDLLQHCTVGLALGRPGLPAAGTLPLRNNKSGFKTKPISP
ncbi:hypothetical protein [Hymenobacter siberiensis]|uniref:hypothetical protein n=1 Tax=Hymenobacter siberiensis TaxID=2848396 RepID=UPI001C1E386A|nr:hypothetical protein [Hymenobacter siberiensis]MBU6120440.1 hypothetical protein [Hymenobacter siberiensis]